MQQGGNMYQQQVPPVHWAQAQNQQAAAMPVQGYQHPAYQHPAYAPPQQLGAPLPQPPPMPQFLQPQIQPLHGNMQATAFSAAPLDAMLDERIRDKIVRNQFVDFSTLARNDPSDSVVVTQLDDDGLPQAQSLLLANGRQKTSMSFTQWQKALYIFATVYGRAFPAEFPNLFKYADTIRELFASRARWEFYDDKFRRLRASSMWPWDCLQMELWGKAMALFRDSEEVDRPSSSGYAARTSHVQNLKRSIPYRRGEQDTTRRDLEPASTGRRKMGCRPAPGHRTMLALS